MRDLGIVQQAEVGPAVDDPHMLGWEPERLLRVGVSAEPALWVHEPITEESIGWLTLLLRQRAGDRVMGDALGQR